MCFDKFRVTMNGIRRTAGVERNFSTHNDVNLSPRVTLFPFLLSSSKQPAEGCKWNEYEEWSYPTREKTAWGCLIGREGGWGETLNRCNSFSCSPPSPPPAKPSAEQWSQHPDYFSKPFRTAHERSCFFSSVLPQSFYTRAWLFVACEISLWIKSPPATMRNFFVTVIRNRELMLVLSFLPSLNRCMCYPSSSSLERDPPFNANERIAFIANFHPCKMYYCS